MVSEPKTVSLLLREIKMKQISTEHYFQREADQWSKENKSGFISTVIKNEDFDSIKLCECNSNGNRKVYLIDGKQRITTIAAYHNNEFAISKKLDRADIDYIDSEGNEQTFNIGGKRYKDLPEELQLQFDSCPITVVKHLDCTESDIAYHFMRYNFQKSLNVSQKAITYTDKFAKIIKEIAENRFFLDCGNYTETDRRNGTIPRLIMECAMTTFFLNDWKKQTAKAGVYLNENATEEQFELLDEYFDRLTPICEDRFSAEFNSKNTFLFVALFHEFAKLDLEDGKFAEFLVSFENQLHSEDVIIDDDIFSFDLLDEQRTTKDKSTVVRKIALLNRLMYQYFNVNEIKKAS